MRLPHNHPVLSAIREEIDRLSAAGYAREEYYQGQIQAYRNLLATIDPLIAAGMPRDDFGAGIALPPAKKG